MKKISLIALMTALIGAAVSYLFFSGETTTKASESQATVQPTTPGAGNGQGNQYRWGQQSGTRPTASTTTQVS